MTHGAATWSGRTDSSGRVSVAGVEGTAVVRATRAYTSEETEEWVGFPSAGYAAEAEVSTDGSEARVALVGPPLGGLVIREVAFTGAEAVGGAHYFHDQYIELFNHGTAPISVAGLLVADVYGAAGEINRGTPPSPYASDATFVFAGNVWRIPWTDARVLQPGEALVIAQDGANHQPDSTLDLSGADYEAFNAREDMRDVDWPTVPNLEKVHFTGGFDWLMTVFGPSVVVARVAEGVVLDVVPDPDDFQDVMKIPASAVLDAVDIVMDAASGDYKRLHPSLDLGYCHASGTYTEESVRRRSRVLSSGRTVLADTNNSSNDFETQQPPVPWAASATP